MSRINWGISHNRIVDYPAGKMTVICAIFLLNKDISQLWYELGDIPKKILFYEESSLFMSQLHNPDRKKVALFWKREISGAKLKKVDF